MVRPRSWKFRFYDRPGGLVCRFNGKIIGRVVPDGHYLGMYRVALPDGTVSDMVNLPRAKDAMRSVPDK